MEDTNTCDGMGVEHERQGRGGSARGRDASLVSGVGRERDSRLVPSQGSQALGALDPSGNYDASPGGEDLIGWHVNNGREKAADFFPASRFRSSFYRPDVIDRVVATLDEGEAVRLANEESGRKEVAVASVRDKLPPVVTILSPRKARK